MFVELHIIQNFAPSNLNRDETGAPKDCEFGGYRRARISSQCLKRAVRTCFQQERLLPEANLAKRTKRIMDRLAEKLVEQGKPEAEARAVIEAALKGLGLALAADSKTQYLLFLGEAEIDAVSTLCAKHWDALLAAVAGEKREPAAGRTTRDAKKAGEKAIPADLKVALEKALNGGKATDLALFGRMLADLPEKNIDAACQVAHAISTHKVSQEFDYYTAVDDLKPKDTAGADMIGTVEFNSACFYRYANVDLEQLKKNLQGDEELSRKTVEAFLRASVAAIPTGKQNSMAAQNPPSAVFAVARSSALWSLANAFVKPVPSQSGDLVQKSLFAMDEHWGKLTRMYGEKGIVGKWLCALEGDDVKNLKGAEVPSVDELVERLLDAVKFEERGGGGK